MPAPTLRNIKKSILPMSAYEDSSDDGGPQYSDAGDDKPIMDDVNFDGGDFICDVDGKWVTQKSNGVG